MQSVRASIKRLNKQKHKVSCHYLIDRQGKIFQMVPDNKNCLACRKIKWKNLKILNDHSIGIELVNKGHKFGYQKFSKKQINALVKLCIKIKKNIKLKIVLYWDIQI